MKRLISLLLSAAICLTLCAFDAGGKNTVSAASDGEYPAFPGAEGGGMYTTGARAAANPEIFHVKNLDDSGTGSLRDAVSQSNRIIVFDVAGTIKLETPIYLKKGNLTILGQTSPGDGICISGAPTYVQASNIIVRYLRFRMGVYDYKNKKYDEDTFTDGKDQDHVIVDHCSMSWSNDECCSLYAIKDSTVQWCLLTEPLNKSIHDEGSGVEEHGYGGLWGGVNMTYHHNFISNANSRFPRVATSATTSSYKGQNDKLSLLDVRNNVFYNWRDNASYGGENMVRVNLVNNYYKEGPASSSIKRFYQFTPATKGSTKGWSTDLAIDGNFYDAKSPDSKVDKINADNTTESAFKFDSGVTTYNVEKYDENEPGTETNHTQYIHDYPINTQSAQDAYELVLDKVGASLKRDYVDELAISDARGRKASRGTNGIVNYDDWIKFEPITYDGKRAPDADNDGMSDAYEEEMGLNKNNASDALEMDSENKYYNIEAYANWLAAGNEIPETTPDPNATPTPKPTATPTPAPTNTPMPTAVPEYNISIDGNIENGSIEINGVSSRTITWEAAEHQSEINGAKTFNLNGVDKSGGTLDIYDPETTVETYEGSVIARADQGSNPNVSAKPFTGSEKPSGSVFMVCPASDGKLVMEYYVYGGSARTVHVYDNANDKDLETISRSAKGIYTFEGECKAGNMYYLWIDGSKLGLKSVRVTGGGIAAKVGETVSVKTVPNAGYKAGSVFTEPETEVAKLEENSYSFTMPNSDVTVGASFVSADTPTPTPTAIPTTAPTPTAAPTAAPTPTAVPTAVPTIAPSPTIEPLKPTDAPVPTESAAPSETPFPSEAPSPTLEPTPEPTSGPTDEPTTVTPTPEAEPTASPEASAAPTNAPEPVTTPEPSGTPGPHDYLYEINGYEFGVDGKINIDLTYNGGGTDRARLIIASYADEGIMTDIKMFDITGNDLSGVDYQNPGGGIKIFIWDPETLAPLSLMYSK